MNTLQSDHNTSFQIKPIGEVKHGENIYNLIISPEYRPALKQLDKFSYAVVLWWADKHDNEGDRNHLVTELPYAPGVEAGVFACRAEYRPNPIGITNCFLIDVDIENGIVQVPWIDAFDGTPLIDLKPYIPVCDRIRDVTVADWFADWPEFMEDGAEFFSEAEIDID